MSSIWAEPSNWQSRPVCVLGAGVLGRRIAACFVAAGHQVIIRDPSADARSQAIAYITDNLGVYTHLTLKKAGSYETTEDLTKAVKDAWLVVEAVPEILTLKEETFADLEKHTQKDCILASNSSSYKSGELCSKISEVTKARVLNMHFMMPPDALIVELMTSGNTYTEIFPFVEVRLKEAGLHPITALKESSGFVFNRIWAAIKREVMGVLAEGVSTPDVIDAMWIEQYSSNKTGPCMLMDAVGLDTVENIEEHYIKERGLPSKNLDWLKSNYIDIGKLGLKTREQGGLYPPPEKGSLTKVFMLNVGLAEPMKGKSLEQIMHSGQILSIIAEHPSKPTEILGGLYNPDGLDICESNRRIYFTTMGTPSKNDGAIQSCNLDGSDLQYVLEPGQVHTGKQLFIDQQTDKIYFCDREGLRVMRSSLDGKTLEILHRTGDWEKEVEKQTDSTYTPVGIAISHKLNKIFWTQKGPSKGGKGRIFSAGIDIPEGQNADNRRDIEVVVDQLPECIDLEFDEERGALYWSDRGEQPLGNTLNRKTLIGEPPADEKALGRAILAQNLGEGIGIRIDKQKRCVYVGDLSGHLWRVPIDGGLKEKIYEGSTHAYTGVTFLKV